MKVLVHKKTWSRVQKKNTMSKRQPHAWLARKLAQIFSSLICTKKKKPKLYLHKNIDNSKEPNHVNKSINIHFGVTLHPKPAPIFFFQSKYVFPIYMIKKLVILIIFYKILSNKNKLCYSTIITYNYWKIFCFHIVEKYEKNVRLAVIRLLINLKESVCTKTKQKQSVLLKKII